MKQYLLPVVAIAVVLICVGLYFFVPSVRNAINPSDSGCDQSATSTDCAKAISTSTPEEVVVQKVPFTSKTVVWKTYTNSEMGISFMYPEYDSLRDGHWQIRRGDEGKAFGANLALPSGASITFEADTKDYVIGKDGFGVGTEGFIERNGMYYAIQRGLPVSYPFVPDEVLTLSNGTKVLIQYGKNFETLTEYTNYAARAMINFPSGEFTGIGFTLLNTDENYHPIAASAEDMATFKRMITSFTFK